MTKIKKGDTVTVLSGKDKGKSGKVIQVWPVTQRALVERINVVKHFDRRTQQNQAGGIVEREGTIALAKLALTCTRCQRPSRVGWKIAADGSKLRLCRRCEETL